MGARRFGRSQAYRLAAALATGLIITSPAMVQAAPAPPKGIAPAGIARPAVLHPSKEARPDGHTVLPFRTIDPTALRVAKERAGLAPSSGKPSIGITAPKAVVYNNTNQSGISAADEGACCTPPDTTGSIGPNHYVEMVNNLVRVYDRSLNRINDADLGTFTGTPAGISTSDPQVQWDSQGNRWLYAAVAFATGNNYLLLGWSKTADPSDLVNGWCHYGIFTANLLQDYPKLGHDNNYLLVGTNEYDDRTAGFAFVTANIWALPKPAPGDASCAVGSSSHFADPTHVLLNADGSVAFTPVPVNTSDSSNAGYIVAAHSPASPPVGAQTKVMAWHIVKGSGGPQLVQDGDLRVQSFNIPPPIPQPGPTLDSLDARLTQAVGHLDPDANAEAVWTQHTVVSTTSRSVVRWYEFIPSQLKVRQQGEIASATDYVFNGAIAPSILGNDAALFYDRANASLTPVIGAVSRTHGDPLSTMGSELLIGSSVAADTDLSCSAPYGPPCRWGDYSGASPDPNAAGVVWGSNQLNGPTFFGYPQWATRNFAVTATVAPDFTLSISPTGRAVTPPGSTTYTVTITDQAGFTGAVTLGASGLPAGTTAAFSPNPTTTTSTLTLTISGSTPAGTNQYTVTGVNGSLSHAAQSTLVVTAASTYASAINADGPNAYWRLGETSGTVMVDSTAGANNGAYVGGVTLNAPGAIAGDGNGAVLLDGSSGFGRAANSPSLSLTGAVSLEAWVKFNATGPYAQIVVNKGDGASATGSAYEIAWIPGTGLGFQTFIGGTRYDADQNFTPVIGQWYDLVGTRSSGGALSFYINGKLVASGNDSGAALNAVTAGVGVGASGDGTGHLRFNGTLDEVAVYPVALTASQVAAHWQAAGVVPVPPTNVTATGGPNQATVSWTPPAGAVTSYVITPQVGSTLRTPQAFAGPASSATVTGLSGGTTYTFTVVARNAVGSGPPSAASNAAAVTGPAYPYAATVLGDNPAGYWRLGETFGTAATDATGSGNGGTYLGGYVQGQSGGPLGDPDPAVGLNGSTGWISLPNATGLQLTGALSVEAWVKFASNSQFAEIIVNKGDGASATGSAYEIAWIPGIGLGFQTFIGGNRYDADQNFTPVIGQWYDLVGTRSATGQLSFYVNGALVANGNDGGAPLNNVSAGVGIGASGNGTVQLPFNGTLDEVAVYPGALTAAQVLSHYHAAGY